IGVWTWPMLLLSAGHRHGAGRRPSRAACPTGWRILDRMDIKDDPPAHLARNLAGLRHARQLTQDALAAAAGLPPPTIANLESGEANPPLAVLVKVAGALAVPIDELLAAPRAKTRKWSADEVGLRSRGRGVTERPLLPEPVPDALSSVMD